MIPLLVDVAAAAPRFPFHAEASAGVGAGAMGLALPAIGPVLDAKVGWVGLPEVRVRVFPTLSWWDGPAFDLQLEGGIGWSIPARPHLRLTPEVGVWTVPTEVMTYGAIPFALYAGVGVLGGKRDQVEASFGLQATAWSDTSITLPLVRVRWHHPQGWFVGGEFCPAFFGAIFGIRVGKP